MASACMASARMSIILRTFTESPRARLNTCWPDTVLRADICMVIRIPIEVTPLTSDDARDNIVNECKVTAQAGVVEELYALAVHNAVKV